MTIEDFFEQLNCSERHEFLCRLVSDAMQGLGYYFSNSSGNDRRLATFLSHFDKYWNDCTALDSKSHVVEIVFPIFRYQYDDVPEDYSRFDDAPVFVSIALNSARHCDTDQIPKIIKYLS